MSTQLNEEYSSVINEEDLECALCTDVYNTDERKPYVLTCGHSICGLCIPTMQEKKLCWCRKAFEHCSVNYGLLKLVQNRRLFMQENSGMQENNPDNVRLYKKASYGNKGVVVEELLAGADVNFMKQDEDGCTPLYIACENGHKEVAALLLERGAQVDKPANKISAPLQVATTNKHQEVPELLKANMMKQHQSRKKQIKGSSFVSSLMPSFFKKSDPVRLLKAAGDGDLAVVREQLLAKTDVDSCDKDGRTTLYMACWKGHKEVATLLMDWGVQVDNPKNDGATPLYVTCGYGHMEVATLLLDRGAQVDKPNNNETTPLCIACQMGHKEVAALLLGRGAQVDKPANGGCTPLYVACQNGRKEVAALLLDRGAQVDKPKNDGETPLYVACRNCHREVAVLLLDRRAQVDKPNIGGCTPLYIACCNSHKEVAVVLLDRGAQVDKPNNDGVTPLIIACWNGHKDVAEMLLDRGAQVDKRDNFGDTPLTAARKQDHREVEALLLQHGAR